MTRKEQIKSAYKLTGSNASFYDGMMTYSTLPGKAICRIIWNMDSEKNLRYLEKALSGIPEDFSGKLLEVPVGTGVLTMPIYRDLPDADITCLDYSENMMASAQAKAKAAYRETYRVLKPGGTFCGCFYVQGGHKRTDWFIRHLYQPKGFFTPPYETEKSLNARLSRLYKEAEVTMVEGMGCFCCRK